MSKTSSIDHLIYTQINFAFEAIIYSLRRKIVVIGVIRANEKKSAFLSLRDKSRSRARTFTSLLNDFK